MRKFSRNMSSSLTCLMAGIAALATAGCYSQSAARRYIEDAEKQWAESVPTRDATVLKRILADDFVWVYPSDGRLLWSKAETIADAEAGPGEDKSGKEIKGRFIWSDVWVRRNGQWQMVQAQDQAIEP